MAFDLSNYEDVDTRIHKFWEANPNGRISTEIVYTGTGENGQLKQVIIRADIWKDKKDANPDATDFAEETQGATPVNRTSFIENCSTSAIGRALATMGYAKKGARPSTAEMTKAERVEEVDPWAAERRTSGHKTEELATGLEMALTAMGAKPQCNCGVVMKRKEGVNAVTGKPYAGWVCQNQQKECKAIWDK